MQQKKIGVLLINLGTPAGPSIGEVRSYLRVFLDDPRVIDLPNIIRKILLYALILPFRPKKSAHAYQQIWDPDKGSPLLFNTQALAQGLQELLPTEYEVVVGMRYGQPSLESALEKLFDVKCEKIIVLPLFPQYSSAATGSAIEHLLSILHKRWNLPSMVIQNSFYGDPGYIQAQAALIAPYWEKRSQYAKLVLSYHSLPVRHIAKSGCSHLCADNINCPAISEDNQYCYRAQCFETSRLLAEHLGVREGDYAVVFQSRLGRTPWVGPDIQGSLSEWHKAGVKELIIACPSFVADCLETLEEIGMRLREEWRSMGGESFHLVPCLNNHPDWLNAVKKMCMAQVQ